MHHATATNIQAGSHERHLSVLSMCDAYSFRTTKCVSPNPDSYSRLTWCLLSRIVLPAQMLN